MIKIDLSRHAPPGMNLSFEKNLFGMGLTAAFLYSTGFLLRFSRELNGLYWRDGATKTLREGFLMQDFVNLLGSAMVLFYIMAFAMLATAVLHYAYHRQGSRSIYLMKRLPNRWELHRRCLTLPIITAAICLLTAFVVLLLYFWYYMAATPEQCLTPDQWQKIWR